MRDFTSKNLKVTCPDLFAYTKDTYIIRVEYKENPESQTLDNLITLSVSDDVERIGGFESIYVMYDGMVEIDITEIINIVKENHERDASSSLSQSVYISTIFGDNIRIPFRVFGINKPSFFIEPPHVGEILPDWIETTAEVDYIILPPSNILARYKYVKPTFVEMFQPMDDFMIEDENDYFNQGEWPFLRDGGDNDFYEIICAGIEVLTINYKPLECDMNYCSLRWPDALTGLTKVFTFERVDEVTETTDVVSIQRLDRGYESKKNGLESFTARIRNLNRYDYNYYADIITADWVECTLDGLNWRKVYVSTDSAKALNGDAETQDLKLNINYNRYGYNL